VETATATIEERELLKTLRWWDGFVVALANPGFLIASLGFSIGTLGAWGAVLIWTASMLIGALQAWIYQEPAVMFPEKSGGIALYAHEGWKKYSAFVGPVATFGYWFGWSSVLSIFGLVIGSLVQAEWFSKSTWHQHIIWSDFNLSKLIGIICIALIWTVNTRGMRPAVWVSYLTGILLCVPLAVVMFGSFLSGDFHSSHMTLHVTGGWPIVLVWLYLMGWSSYATEVCATFAPEYVATEKDTPMALRTSSLFNLIVFFMLPLGVVGTLTAAQVAGKDGSNAAGGYLVDTMRRIVGGGSTGLLLMFVIAGLLLSMNTATMDGSRALYGISQDGMTVKGLGKLNRHHVPGNAMTTDAVMNILLLVVFQNTLAILAASNLGYILSHVAALTAVILLRMDRPHWPRPIRLSSFWITLAGILAAANVVFIVVGFVKFGDTGYAGKTKWLGIHNELWIGVGILIIGVLLFVYRRVVQDKGRIHWRDPEVPDVPAPSAGIHAPAPAG
jgi:amino acid transporter